MSQGKGSYLVFRTFRRRFSRRGYLVASVHLLPRFRPPFPLILLSLALLMLLTTACEVTNSTFTKTSLSFSTARFEKTTAQTYDPCQARHQDFPWEGSYRAQRVQIPSTAMPAKFWPGRPLLPGDFTGTILAPGAGKQYAGPRPAIVVMHGSGGNQCSLWWMARDLAGHGYIALTLTSPTRGNYGPANLDVMIDAVRSSVDFLHSSLHNPYHSITATSQIGLVGYSQGSIAVSEVQGMPDMAGVRAAVTLDNLRHWLFGDPDGALRWCTGTPQDPVTPRVPTLSFAKDAFCTSNPLDQKPDLKQTGWDWWRAHNISTVEMVMAAFTHGTFIGDNSAQLQPLSHFILDWFGAWLEFQHTDLKDFTSCQTQGKLTTALLSRHYDSAEYLPSLGVNTARLIPYLTAHCHP